METRTCELRDRDRLHNHKARGHMGSSTSPNIHRLRISMCVCVRVTCSRWRLGTNGPRSSSSSTCSWLHGWLPGRHGNNALQVTTPHLVNRMKSTHRGMWTSPLNRGCFTPGSLHWKIFTGFKYSGLYKPEDFDQVFVFVGTKAYN